MVQPREQILQAFGGQVNMRIAFQFSRDEIKQFLGNVRANPVAFGAAGTDIPAIQALCQDIARLWAFDGTHYSDPSLRPEQHILRVLHPEWPREYISKFRLGRHLFKDVNFWSLPDLLGLVLNLLGPAPAGATRRNFFLPLIAMFGKWCQKLCVEYPPVVLQCTWTTGGNGEYFLGASMSGYNVDKVETGSWLAVLNRARFSVISTERFRLSGWSQAWSPSIRRRRRDGRPFGRCAETYPLRFLLRDTADKSAIHGLGLSARVLWSTHAYDDRLAGPIWEGTWNPCSNCMALIENMEGLVANFNRYNGRRGAPA
ncbi:hypothetical protein BDV25DRAFT_167850 [Aspergillus avenaceus]|uniref:Uncharacterized protein n=1 Tax=Aspergillus avenaceus TaxID=36643 RepID=A0A5N6U6V7_ASPAV|nr:hypothetical protein BDV25DRAFT_167850 [Aspergillus avenaceus]